MLRQLWLSRPAREVFHAHSLGMLVSRLAGHLGILPSGPLKAVIQQFESETGCTTFEDLRIPLRVVATDLLAGRPVVFSSGPLAPALEASAAIPGVFSPVKVDGRVCSDGGIVDNTPISTAVEEGYGLILAIGVMSGGEITESPSSLTELIARTLQLNLHQRFLSDFERLRARVRIVGICPVTAAGAAWDMRLSHVHSLIEKSHAAARGLIDRMGGSLFDRSAIHYLDLTDCNNFATRTARLADAV